MSTALVHHRAARGQCGQDRVSLNLLFFHG